MNHAMASSSNPLKIAAITMVWNEALFLPLWLEYYGRQLGRDNLFVIDNDSDDGTTSNLYPSSRIRYERTQFDDVERAKFVSNFANFIRRNYDAVIVADCDEFLVPDPSIYTSLGDYVARTPGDALASIGLNVHHVLGLEAALDSRKPIFSQRRHVQFVSPMCKPLITRTEVNYGPGFHNCSLTPSFGKLYNFHLRWADYDYAFKRLSMTRQMAWKDLSGWHYQRQSDEETAAHFKHFNSLERRIDDEFQFSDRLSVILAAISEQKSSSWYKIPDARDKFLTVLPVRFNGLIL
jgi:hypothetical protein